MMSHVQATPKLEPNLVTYIFSASNIKATVVVQQPKPPLADVSQVCRGSLGSIVEGFGGQGDLLLMIKILRDLTC